MEEDEAVQGVTTAMDLDISPETAQERGREDGAKRKARVRVVARGITVQGNVRHKGSVTTVRRKGT